MYKRGISLRIFLGLISVILIFLYFFIIHGQVAQASELSKYYDKYSTGYTQVKDMPEALKKLCKNTPVQNAPYPSGTYEQGQCTWYAYNRAKDSGRKFSTFEGDGGDWYLDYSPSSHQVTHTTGDETPKPQTTISYNQSYCDLDSQRHGYTKDHFFFTTHVEYVEYIDSAGYGLITAGNCSGIDTNQGTIICFHILSPDAMRNHHAKYTTPLNAKSLKDWGKNPDGSGSGSSDVGSSKNTVGSQGDDSNSLYGNLKPADNNFIVNGYGTIKTKDWNEISIEGKLPSKEMVAGLSISQKMALAQWVADYGNSGQATLLKIIRMIITYIGLFLVIYAVVLSLMYCLDRVGVLEYQFVKLLTSGNYETVYSREEAEEVKERNVKPMTLGKLITIVLVCLVVFTLVITGNMYYIVYNLYTFLAGIVDFMNKLH